METFINIALLGTFIGFVVHDAVRPARSFPKTRLWKLKGLTFTALHLTVATLLPLVWNDWLGEHRIFDLTSMGIAAGTVVALLIAQFGGYWWHRALHTSPTLWRMHQMHHSPERVDSYGALYHHPIDAAGFAFVGSLFLVWVVGLPAESVIIASAIQIVLVLFGHLNARTPAWLGYFVQRPENHGLHHARGVHRYNYGDMALWDQVFGTWRNPETWEGEGGFYDGASSRMGEILVGLDVSEPRGAAATVARSPEASATALTHAA